MSVWWASERSPEGDRYQEDLADNCCKPQSKLENNKFIRRYLLRNEKEVHDGVYTYPRKGLEDSEW
jgi:hypothetical protein